ncbi:MAG: hypothetical protein ACNYPH_04890 [Gammaproteobacteria bacterium WSBS_2016_MAG_OTU1]
MNCKICHITQLFRTAKEGGLIRREFMRRAGLMGLAFHQQQWGWQQHHLWIQCIPKVIFHEAICAQPGANDLPIDCWGDNALLIQHFDDCYAAAADLYHPKMIF